MQYVKDGFIRSAILSIFITMSYASDAFERALEKADYASLTKQVQVWPLVKSKELAADSAQKLLEEFNGTWDRMLKGFAKTTRKRDISYGDIAKKKMKGYVLADVSASGISIKNAKSGGKLAFPWKTLDCDARVRLTLEADHLARHDKNFIILMLRMTHQGMDAVTQEWSKLSEKRREKIPQAIHELMSVSMAKKESAEREADRQKKIADYEKVFQSNDFRAIVKLSKGMDGGLFPDPEIKALREKYKEKIALANSMSKRRNVINFKFNGKGAARILGRGNAKVMKDADGNEVIQGLTTYDDPNSKTGARIPIAFPEGTSAKISHDLYVEFDILCKAEDYRKLNIHFDLDVNGHQKRHGNYVSAQLMVFMGMFMGISHQEDILAPKNPNNLEKGEWTHCVVSITPGSFASYAPPSTGPVTGDVLDRLQMYIDKDKMTKVSKILIKNIRVYNYFDDSLEEVNKLDQFKYSKFHRACISGDVDLMQKMIDAGADLKKLGNMFNSPLCFAVKSGKTEAVQFLLDKGLDINERNGPLGKTALVGASNFPKMDMLTFLLLKGADPRHKVNRRTIAQWAKDNNNLEAHRLMMASAEVLNEHEKGKKKPKQGEKKKPEDGGGVDDF